MSEATASERTIVTVVSADVVGSTRHILGSDPEDAQAFLDRCFEEFRAAMESYGGKLISYAGDGGVAVFGWPDPLEDHADRACAAAWRLQHPEHRAAGPAGLPVSLRLGVHSGLVGVRHLDQPGREGWNAVGAAVNIAAKLQQAARPGEVLVSAATVDLCRSALALGPFTESPGVAHDRPGAFHLHAEPDLAARRSGERYRTPLVGRDAELLWLTKRVLVEDESCRVASLVGEAGIGKSRLAHALSTKISAIGWQTTFVHGDPQTRASPFAAALAMVGAVLGLPENASRESLRGTLVSRGLDEETLSLISRLLGDGARGGASNPMPVARAFVRVLLGVVRERPLLLLIEDLHFVDLESQIVLRLLTPEQANPSLALVVTGRPEALQDIREIGGELLELQPLAHDQMRDIAQLVCPEGTAPEVLERVVERADGVVFVLEELARSIGAATAAGDLPVSVESAIHARLGRLSRDARSLAQTLSLLGEQVELDFLERVAAVKNGQLPVLLAELERLAFVHPPRGQRAGFRHHILAEACANTIPRQRRIALHRAALHAIEAGPGDVWGQSLRLAAHAEGAGENARALTFLWQAATEARGSSAASSLNLIFDRALAVIEEIGDAAAKTYVDFVLMAFPSMLLLGEFSKMRTHLPKAMAFARAQKRADKVSNGLSQLGMLCWFEGRYDEGRQATEEGRRIARELDLPALVYSNQLMLANVLHGMGRIDDALAELADLQALLTGPSAEPRWGAPAVPLSTTLSFIGWVLADTERLEESLQYGRRGLEIARRERDAYAEIMARNALGRALLHMGRNAEAVSCLQVAYDLAETHGYDAPKSNLAGHLASALARLGRADEAIALAQGCLTRRLHLRTGRMENVLLKTGYGEAIAAAGDHEQGLALLDEALEIAAQMDNPGLLTRSLEVRGAIWAKSDPDDPRAAADRAAAAIQRGRILGATAPPASA